MGAKKITKKEFDRIKELQGLGVNLSDTARIVKRSQGSVHRIRACKDWAEFSKPVVKPEPKFEQVIDDEPLKETEWKDGKFTKHYEAKLMGGNFEEMMRIRKQQLPNIRKNIDKILSNYEGESIVILIQKEDENGKPEKTLTMMAGTSTPETQVAMAKALHETSNIAIEVLMDSAKGDIRKTIAIAQALTDIEVE